MSTPKETSVDYIAGEKYALVFSADRKWISRIRTLVEQCPDEMEIVAENKDGSILAHIPPDYVFKFKGKRKMSEEQKQACAARLKEYNKQRAEGL